MIVYTDSLTVANFKHLFLLTLQLYEVYTKQGSSRINQADFFSLCLQLEDRRIIDIKKNKQKSVDRQSKVSLHFLKF